MFGVQPKERILCHLMRADRDPVKETLKAQEVAVAQGHLLIGRDFIQKLGEPPFSDFQRDEYVSMHHPYMFSKIFNVLSLILVLSSSSSHT